MNDATDKDILDFLNCLILDRLNNGILFQRDLELFFKNKQEALDYAKKNHFSGICIVE